MGGFLNLGNFSNYAAQQQTATTAAADEGAAQAAAAQHLEDQLNKLSTKQIQDGIDDETASDKENADWIKWLKDPANANTGTGLLSGNYTILIFGGAAFLVVLILISVLKKK